MKNHNISENVSTFQGEFDGGLRIENKQQEHVQIQDQRLLS